LRRELLQCSWFHRPHCRQKHLRTKWASCAHRWACCARSPGLLWLCSRR
jgi:hypothetical protein